MSPFRSPLWFLFVMACGATDSEPVPSSKPTVSEVDSPSEATPKIRTALEVYDQLVTELNHGQATAQGGEALPRDAVLSAVVEEHLHRLNNEPFKSLLGANASSYATVLGQVRAEALPEVLAAVPMRKSMYNPNIQSGRCATGYWQLTPKTALSLGLKVSECRLSSGTTWSPKGDSVADSEVAAYLTTVEEGDEECLITECAVDERMDLALSTKAMLQKMKTVYNESTIQKSGASVQAVLKVNQTVQEVPRPLPNSPPTSGEASLAQKDAPRPLLGRMSKEGDYEASIIAIHLLARCVFGHESIRGIAEFKSFSDSFTHSYCEALMKTK